MIDSLEALRAHTAALRAELAAFENKRTVPTVENIEAHRIAVALTDQAYAIARGVGVERFASVTRELAAYRRSVRKAKAKPRKKTP